MTELKENFGSAQRLLWASTGAKNPDYSDVKYIEALVGPEAINTAPLKTFDACRDHGDPGSRLEENLKEARTVLERLPEFGIDLDTVTQQLEDDGVIKFNKPFDKLMNALEQRAPHSTAGVDARTPRPGSPGLV